MGVKCLCKLYTVGKTVIYNITTHSNIYTDCIYTSKISGVPYMITYYHCIRDNASFLLTYNIHCYAHVQQKNLCMLTYNIHCYAHVQQKKLCMRGMCPPTPDACSEPTSNVVPFCWTWRQHTNIHTIYDHNCNTVMEVI